MSMKKLRNIGILLVLATVAIIGCNDEINEMHFPGSPIGFKYYSPTMDYLVGEQITFENTSIEGSAYLWDFGDGSTSTEESPTHKYSQPRTYKVTLTIDNGKYITQGNIMISDIIPRVSFKTADQRITYNSSEVEFSVNVANPENQTITYTWTFPTNTMGEGIDSNGTSFLQNPVARFGKIGSQKVKLTVKLGERELQPVQVNVKVNYDKPTKTLYYAVKGGNIMAKKIINEGEIDNEVNQPFDFGYRSGKHPLTLQFAGDWLYVFDAGTITGYSATPDNSGDGEIFSVYHDGSKRESIIENFGGNTFCDFYYGYIDEENNMLYWADRRTGILRTTLSTRNAKLNRKTDDRDLAGYEPYFVKNNRLGYYGVNLSYGAQNGTFRKYKGQWWWAKHTLGSGIYRFEEKDILASDRKEGDPVPAAGTILVNVRKIRCFVIDEVNEILYYSTNDDYRIRRCRLDGTGTKTIDLNPMDSEGGTEGLSVTGMAIDGEYMYYAFRGAPVPEGEDPEAYYSANPLAKSGIKRVKLSPNPGDEAIVEYFIEGVDAYGLAIDNQLR